MNYPSDEELYEYHENISSDLLKWRKDYFNFLTDHGIKCKIKPNYIYVEIIPEHPYIEYMYVNQYLISVKLYYGTTNYSLVDGYTELMLNDFSKSYGTWEESLNFIRELFTINIKCKKNEILNH